MMLKHLKPAIKNLPFSPGVYIFKNKQKKVIYVGKSIKLKERVKSYFHNFTSLGDKSQKMVNEIYQIDHIVTDSELEALILEAALIKQYKPLYNSQLKDDKNYFFIEIQNGKLWQEKGISYVVKQNLWPHISLTHQTKNKSSLYFGPFISGKEVKQAMKILRQIFGWCEYKTQKQLKINKKPCFYHHLGLCPGVCAGQLDLRGYWRSFKYLIWFLQGKKTTVINKLQTRMDQAAKKLRFEQAAKYKDLIDRLNNLTTAFHTPDDYLKNPNLAYDIHKAQLNDLCQILDIKLTDNWFEFAIEAYDISHLAETAGVGSRVVFVGGKPDKTKYRRYRLKTAVPNDYQAMAEVIKRRLKKTNDLPDLIVVDGGKGQLSTVKKILDQAKIQLEVVGLAKKPDRLIVWHKGQQTFKTVKLTNRPGLFLLQRLRNEAHRFANNYRLKLLKIQKR